jgi:hypothetical protein
MGKVKGRPSLMMFKLCRFRTLYLSFFLLMHVTVGFFSQVELYFRIWDQNIDFGITGGFLIDFRSYYQFFQPGIECVGGE